MDAKDRKKYDDMLHDLEEKRRGLEEKRKKINENEKMWQRESRELKKMQFWPRTVGAPAGAWDAAQQVHPGVGGPPQLVVGEDSKPAAAQILDEDTKNAAEYAVAAAEAAIAIAGSASKAKEESGGSGKEFKKRKSSSRSSSRSNKRKARSVEAETDVGESAAV